MRIAVGSDDAGYPLKAVIVELLESLPGVRVTDLGIDASDTVLYPDIAERVALAVARGDCERGILVCGTGIGMAITACKVPGIRAAVCHDTYSAERARKSNDAQILAMGARVIGTEYAKQIVRVWLDAEFAGGASVPKLERLRAIERKYLMAEGLAQTVDGESEDDAV